MSRLESNGSNDDFVHMGSVYSSGVAPRRSGAARPVGI